MFDHVKFGVSNFDESKAFFLQALEPLGVAVVSEGPPAYGVELAGASPVSLCLFQTDGVPAPLHIAFVARERAQVDAFHRAALAAGGRDHGGPGLRPHYHAHYYAAFVIGPDGHNIEVVCHAPEAPAAGLSRLPGAERLAACSCGQLQARVVGDPVRVSVCHCLACQRRTGSVFGAQARFPQDAVTLSGRSTEFVRVGDEGTHMSFHFCPTCGATVYYALPGGFIAIPVGAFADPSFPAPSVSVYEERMHGWVQVPGDVTHLA